MDSARPNNAAAPDGQPEDGGQPDTAELMAMVYDELRALAAQHLRHERVGHTLQPTALVHEAYVRLLQLDQIRWKDRVHFFIAAAGTIRRVLVDHARARSAGKRGGGARERLTLSAVESLSSSSELDVLALDEALSRLAALDPRKARVVELRFFGGLTIEEAAGAIGIGTTTVEDDWAFARSWLRRELASDLSGNDSS